MIERAIAAALVGGFILMFWSVPRAHSAEQREPFKWALVMALPAKPQEVRHLFDSETACNLDLASAANVVPKATKLKCERRGR